MLRFTEEEMKFINCMLEDELFEYSFKRSRIEDYSKVKEYDEFVKPRKEFIENMLRKIQKLQIQKENKMQYLVECDSLENLSSYIENCLENMAEDLLHDGEIDYLPSFKVAVVEDED